MYRAYLGTDELDGRTWGDKQLDQEHVLAWVRQGQQERLAGLCGLCSTRETKRKRLRLEGVDYDLRQLPLGLKTAHTLPDTLCVVLPLEFECAHVCVRCHLYHPSGLTRQSVSICKTISDDIADHSPVSASSCTCMVSASSSSRHVTSALTPYTSSSRPTTLLVLQCQREVRAASADRKRKGWLTHSGLHRCGVAKWPHHSAWCERVSVSLLTCPCSSSFSLMPSSPSSSSPTSKSPCPAHPRTRANSHQNCQPISTVPHKR